MIKHLRDLRIFIKKKYFDDVQRFKIEHHYKNIINLEEESEDEAKAEAEVPKNKVVPSHSAIDITVSDN